MSTEVILGAIFVFIIISFIGGMLLLPQLFGISKESETKDSPLKDDEKK